MKHGQNEKLAACRKPFYNREPAIPKEEAYKAVGTQLISDDLGTPGSALNNSLNITREAGIQVSPTGTPRPNVGEGLGVRGTSTQDGPFGIH